MYFPIIVSLPMKYIQGTASYESEEVKTLSSRSVCNVKTKAAEIYSNSPKAVRKQGRRLLIRNSSRAINQPKSFQLLDWNRFLDKSALWRHQCSFNRSYLVRLFSLWQAMDNGLMTLLIGRNERKRGALLHQPDYRSVDRSSSTAKRVRTLDPRDHWILTHGK